MRQIRVQLYRDSECYRAIRVTIPLPRFLDMPIISGHGFGNDRYEQRADDPVLYDWIPPASL